MKGNGFGREYRLLKTDEFSSVFSAKRRLNCRILQILRSQPHSGLPRLGLVVGKKTAKQAVRRNYMKRVVRDWFRCHKNLLDACDYVVRVQLPFSTHQRGEVLSELNRLLLRESSAQKNGKMQ